MMALRLICLAAISLAAARAASEKTPSVQQAEPADTRIVVLPGLAPPAPKPAEPRYPKELEGDSAAFCQARIGRWRVEDARAVLGAPATDRPSFGKGDEEDGRIYAFSDPTGRHMRLELDFDAKNGLLRTVFAYPWDMRWTDCVRLWGARVASSRANKGRTFYSYTDRRLDVLVEADGKVVSLGLY